MISFSDGTNTNSQATYTCNEGFELDESNTRFCRSTGVWTGPDRRCLRKSIILSNKISNSCTTIAI